MRRKSGVQADTTFALGNFPLRLSKSLEHRDLVTLDGLKHPDGSFDATVYVDGKPCGDPALTVARGLDVRLTGVEEAHVVKDILA